MTNFERIKAMTLEEMAKAMAKFIDCFACPLNCNDMCEQWGKCSESFAQWLDSEVDDGSD